jgi:hypothetical protein
MMISVFLITSFSLTSIAKTTKNTQIAFNRETANHSHSKLKLSITKLNKKLLHNSLSKYRKMKTNKKFYRLKN